MERLSGPSPSGVERPPLIQALSAEKTKARMIYATRPLNQLCRRICYIMDTVTRVASVASEGCCQGSFDNPSAFHHILLHQARSRCLVWPTGGGGVMWGVSCCLGDLRKPECVPHFQRSEGGIPSVKEIAAPQYLYDSCMCNFQATHGPSARKQRLTAADAIHVTMLVSFMCEHFLGGHQISAT